MNKINYDLLMENTLSELRGRKPKLLLHACCAPCSTTAIERLKDSFDITVYFYNPNMDGEAEYAKRARELTRLCKIFGVDLVIEKYDNGEFYPLTGGLENEPERGKRCLVCYGIRLTKTAEYAKENGYEYFATTLTLSPHKDAEKLNLMGEKQGIEKGVKYLYSDFKKRGGYLRSIKLSKEYDLYRQSYCGCEYSKRDKK